MGQHGHGRDAERPVGPAKAKDVRVHRALELLGQVMKGRGDLEMVFDPVEEVAGGEVLLKDLEAVVVVDLELHKHEHVLRAADEVDGDVLDLVAGNDVEDKVEGSDRVIVIWVPVSAVVRAFGQLQGSDVDSSLADGEGARRCVSAQGAGELERH